MTPYATHQREIRSRDHRTIAILLAVIVAAIALISAGCGAKAVRAPLVGPLTIEQFARGVRADLAAFLKAAQKNHPECSADKPTAKQGICPPIHAGIDVSNRMGNIINVYCSGTPLAADDPATPYDERKPYRLGGPCSPVPGVKPQLQAVIAEALTWLAQNAQGGN